MITKHKKGNKPVLTNIRRVLSKLRFKCQRYKINRVIIPPIGCGLDKLKWEDVSSIIKETLCNHQIRITVCNFKSEDVIDVIDVSVGNEDIKILAEMLTLENVERLSDGSLEMPAHSWS